MSEPAITVTAPTNPPSGGGIGSTAPGGNPASVPGPTFTQIAAQVAAETPPVTPAVSTAVTPPAAPAATPPVAAAPTGPTIEELQARLAQMPTAEELAQMQQLARIGYQHQQALLQQQQTQTPTAPTAPVGIQPHPITGVIPFTDADKAWLTTSADGKVEAIPGAPADILARYHQSQQSTMRFYREFAQDPEKFLGQVIEKRAKEIAAQEYETRTKTMTQQSAAEKIMSENREWIYQKGPDGQIARDIWGNPKVSEHGSTYLGFVEMLHEQGIKDPTMLHNTARSMLLGHLAEKNMKAPPLTAPAAPAAPAPVDPKQALLARAAELAQQTPNTLATVASPAPAGRLSFMDLAKQVAAEQGRQLSL